ncbi:MAG: GPW/gp25 family protein [Candidatus Heimdallarchaeaceae archaeon]
MANLLDRFKTQVIGSEESLRDYLSIIAAIGDFKRIDDLNVIINSWNNILLTPRGTYLHDPEFGSDLYKYVFEPADDSTVDGIKREVVDRINLYDDRAAIEDVEVTISNNGKQVNISIFVNYQGEKGILDVKFDDTTFADFLTRTAT